MPSTITSKSKSYGVGVGSGVAVGVGVGDGNGVGVGSGIGVGVGDGVGDGVGVGGGVGFGVGVGLGVGIGVSCEQEMPHGGVVGCTYAVGERPAFGGVVVAVGGVCWTAEVEVALMRPEPDGDDAAVCVELVAEAAGSRCKVTLSIKALKLINRTIKTARAMMANRLEMDGRTGGGGGRGIVG